MQPSIARWSRIVFCSLVKISLTVDACAAPQAQASAEAPLRVYASSSWGPPFLLPRKQATDPYRGFIPDWYDAMARVMNRPIELIFLPPNRLSRESALGQQDFRCFGSPSWVPAGATPWYLDAAQAFIDVDEVLVGAAPLVARLEDLDGKRIGTVTGYAYPLLAAAFDGGRLRREDAPDELAMLRKQLHARTDYAVIRHWTLQYLQRMDPQWARLQVSPLRVSRTSLYCGVRRGGRLAVETIELAQGQLIRDGSLARLLAGYGVRYP